MADAVSSSVGSLIGSVGETNLGDGQLPAGTTAGGAMPPSRSKGSMGRRCKEGLVGEYRQDATAGGLWSLRDSKV